jgi:hypothetical protein
MKFTLIASTLLTVLAYSCDAANASLHPSRASADQGSIVLKLSDLRSAYLQRAGVVRYDQANMSPEGLRQQLRQHFDVVLGLLLVSTPQSIETAVKRLEAADEHTWTVDERRAWRQQLLATRHLQMRRLAAYRDRGLFPLNEGQAIHAVPIFVDRHDTACAVGQLMRWSGWQQAVADIQELNNLVYVPDAHHTSLASWILTSGLTLEEAALIQPAYGGLYTSVLMRDYEPGELSLVQSGLKFENFRLVAQNLGLFSRQPAFTKGSIFAMDVFSLHIMAARCRS